MHFASDNSAGAAAEIVDAIAKEAARFGGAYGDSALDQAVEARFSEVFERDVAVLFVGTGSAANGLALASIAKPGGVFFCHRESHILEDECGGVEFLASGSRLIGLDGPTGKLDSASLAAAIARFAPGFSGGRLSPRSVHAGQPAGVSISQMTEAGGIYGPDEIRAIATAARERGLPLHMDGARFANALVYLGVSPAEMSWRAGVDLLSFGATKNGCVAAEALVIFDPEQAREAPYLRKRAGQLFSKSRFIAAQFDAYFRDGLWLGLARHANQMADRLRAGLRTSRNAREAWPTHGNEVFVALIRDDAERLRKAGAQFHEWSVPHSAGLSPDQQTALVRFVTSFATRPDEVDALVELLAG